MKIIPLSEGSFTVDGTKIFVPFDPATETMQQRPSGSLLVEVQPFLIITEHDYILCDLGLGFKTKDGILQIHQNLVDNGINPLEITKVLMSHLHKDHAGGVSVIDEVTGERSLSFPHATYYVNKQEMAYAIEKDGKSYHAEDVALLQSKDNVVFVDGTGTIDGYIHYELSGGHCPYHQVFLIDDGTDKVFFGGDEAPQISQMRSKFVAKYDFDGKKAMELRQEYLAKGKEEDWIFLFYHDIKTPFSKM
ncbi:glyoxylase-like metal-dependent hydrolase (beta-lactamase superfamily II) [Chitinophaga skermanii]|uniref:Glyoxylase-like metal-dependent hydrolase (Beta-lactamase superfamily II) n=1 Tax=Chitinophaga skermanii TaxID=331697 RepID=A0A327QIE6_9BACT|nr:MBL fold metallo-hydrolase [Chitinophaga skermanii]RAJ04130.1 glyoxylase-like metal-dependent hydrolase (beta-lactamase superfamily II) [Chitinophaga skermanii]